MQQKIDNLAINAIRVLSAEAVQAANSGHPGLPMGAAPMAFELWANHMNHNPKDPNWINRDRFILSAGHGSTLVYSLLHLFGYGLTTEDLSQFRQWDSLTPGHPEHGHTTGVEATTGPLGAGFTAAIGMAMAEANLAAKFSTEKFKPIDHNIYTIVGDGCLMEGITSEAASLAGTLKLGKVIALYDSNNITIEGSTDIAFTEDVEARFKAYGWQVLEVADGNDTVAIGKAIETAKANIEQPTLIIVSTLIGFGCPGKQGKASAHGEPLGTDHLAATKENLEWPCEEPFEVPDEVYARYNEAVSKNIANYDSWTEQYEAYKQENPELAAELASWLKGSVEASKLDLDDLLSFDDKPAATRNLSSATIQKLCKAVPNMFGGAADLAPSTKTYMNGKGDFSKDDYSGMNLHFGVRELAMSGIANGISLYGAHKTFVATFFVFSDYMKPMMRLAALMKQPVTYVLTHDSIGVGEDGPTHQPIEQLSMLRSMPNFVTFRPADGKETAAGWYYAITSKETPTALVLTRQNLPSYANTGMEALKGAYILSDSEKSVPDIILMASGSEVSCVMDAADTLRKEGVDARVVSMPSMELFDGQSDEYKESVLPAACRKRVSIEAGSTMSWYRYVGLDGVAIGIDTYGASGPFSVVFEKYGITADSVVDTARKLMNK